MTENPSSGSRSSTATVFQSALASPAALEARYQALADKMARLERLHLLSSSTHRAILRSGSRSELFAEAVRVAVESSGIVMAWIGAPDEEGRIRPLALAGAHEGYLDEVRISIQESPLNRGPAGRAYQNAEVVVANDIENDESMAPWREAALRRGFRAAAAFPLRVQGTIRALYALYAPVPGFFDHEELELLESMSESLSFGLETLEKDAQRERAEEELKRSEERFQLAVQSCLAGIWDWTKLGDDIYYSARYAEMLGYTPEEFPPKIQTFFDHVHPDDREYIRAEIEAHVSPQRKPYLVEFRMRTKSGAYRWFRATAQAVYDAGGNGIRMVGSTFDITESKEAELRASSALEEARRLRQALDRVPSHIYIKDTQSRYLDANQSTLELFRCGAHELAGSPDERFFPPEVARKLRDIDARVFSGATTREEIIVPQPGGARKVYLEIKTPLRESGAEGPIIGLLGISTDITASKEAEQAIRESESRFRQIAETIQDVFWIRDLQSGSVLYVSPAYERIWGRPASEITEHPQAWFDSVHEEDRPAVARCAQGVLDQTGWDITYRIRRTDGSIRWVHERALPVRDSTGKVYRITGVSEDITDKRKLESHLLRSQRMESIGTLAGGIAHDINNILAPITISTSLLKTMEADPEKISMLATIETSAMRGADLVRQILSFARGQEGHPVLLNLNRVALEIGKIVHDFFPRNIEFRVDAAPQLWPVQADPTHIHQVLMNLCVNARDAMPEGGILSLILHNLEIDEVYASMNANIPPGRYVVVSVRDTGAGIPEDILDKIFDPFFTTKEVGKGTGLGLSTGQSLVHGHGGFIRVQSKPGKGSTFSVHLPASTIPATPERPQDAETRDIPRGRGECILLVDDEEAIRGASRRTLENHGYEVLEAGNGAEAVALYAGRAGHPALVILDMSMPVMDGPSTMLALKALDPGVRIIASSGMMSAKDMAKAQEAGVSQFVSKPYTSERLLLAVSKVLHPEATIS